MARNLRQPGGFTFIELLMATAVLAIGMGGMSALMLSAAGGTSEAGNESLAHLHADAMAATLQLSPGALEHIAHPPLSSENCFENEGCDNRDWVINQYLLWRARVALELPGGSGTVCRDSTPMDGDGNAHECDGSGPVVTKVFWTEPRKTGEHGGGSRRAVMQVPQ